MTNYMFKTNKSNRTTTSSRYQMSFYSITTHGQLRLLRLLSIFLITSASCRLAAYAIVSKEETFLSETDVWTTAIIRKQAIYIKHKSTTGRVLLMGASEGHSLTMATLPPFVELNESHSRFTFSSPDVCLSIALATSNNKAETISLASRQRYQWRRQEDFN